jgi:hypothetical protein
VGCFCVYSEGTRTAVSEGKRRRAAPSRARGAESGASSPDGQDKERSPAGRSDAEFPSPAPDKTPHLLVGRFVALVTAAYERRLGRWLGRRRRRRAWGPP